MKDCKYYGSGSTQYCDCDVDTKCEFNEVDEEALTSFLNAKEMG